MWGIKVARALESTWPRVTQHPFNHAIKTGQLPFKQFEQFIKQDKYYLKYYAYGLSQIAGKLSDPIQKEKLEQVAQSLFQTEQNMHKKYLPSNILATFFSPPTASLIIWPAVQNYLNHLHTAQHQAPMIALAAHLPCVMLYTRLGREMQPYISANHPYKSWIESYGSAKFCHIEKTLVNVVELEAYQADEFTQTQALKAFMAAVDCEISFWNSANFNGPIGQMNILAQDVVSHIS
ncbi:MAG TPA: hypothetical protein DCG13_04660 [Legionellales bacterium]|nr:hypothetical protein [Legionellales bacterium]HCA89620.1 hypothetical protein [Legionellales bacterium]|tara:strand:+ start:297 stop:1001 length:705 start_codon:yes stop_codon:yes gene_type:complete